MNSEKPLTYLLGHTMKMVRFKLMEKFRENKLDLNIEQFTLLLFINENPAVTQQNLANHFLRDKSIITRQINTLIDMQYIVRMQDFEDKRKKKLTLTKKGHDWLQTMKKLSFKISSELLEGVSEEEFANFENVLSKIQFNTGFKECLSLS